jgi:hypothetical protein
VGWWEIGSGEVEIGSVGEDRRSYLIPSKQRGFAETPHPGTISYYVYIEYKVGYNACKASNISTKEKPNQSKDSVFNLGTSIYVSYTVTEVIC